MYDLTPIEPELAPAVRFHDPFAVALANACLFGVGYLMLGRRWWAAVTGLVTAGLVAVLTVTAQSGVEVVLLVWWAAMVVHGWFLAGGWSRRAAVRWQRLVAVGLTVPVLAAVGFLRFDAANIGEAVTDARRSGDCAQATDALDQVTFAHRVVDAPQAARVDRTARACERLTAAARRLSAAGSAGRISALSAGFDELAAVLAEYPGHERMVEVVLNGFLDDLPAAQPCDTVAITDWLGDRPASENVLDQSREVIASTAPAALVGCADARMALREWDAARQHYQQLLDQYPDHDLTAQARKGVRRATLAIELANVRQLLDGPTSTQPEYCSHPARYSAAPPYGAGTNRALIYGNDEYATRLPAAWRTSDATKAVLVICLGETDYGTAVETCPYENPTFPRFPQDVTFHRIAIPVQAYELRTGRLVVDTRIEIGGASCPEILEYTTPTHIDLGPPSQVYVEESDADVRAGFAPVITP